MAGLLSSLAVSPSQTCCKSSGLGAAQLSFAIIGAWNTSQELWSSLLGKAMHSFRGYKFLARKMRIRM